jgi:dihydroxyacetone kinase
MVAKVPAGSSIHVSKAKMLLNEVPATVDDALIGLAMVSKGLVILENQCVIMCRDHAHMKGKVKLISGGGSGHEPAHASYVGPGMLTASVIVDVFIAPPLSIIIHAIRVLMPM